MTMRHMSDLYNIIIIQLVFYVIVFTSTYFYLKYVQRRYKYSEPITIEKVFKYNGIYYVPISGIFISVTVILIWLSVLVYEFFQSTNFYKMIQNIFNKEI